MGKAANNIQRSIAALLTFGQWVTVITIAYGAVSVLSGLYCTFSHVRFWYGCAVPLVVGGMVMIILGMRAHKFGSAIQQLRLSLDEDRISRSIADHVIAIVPSLRKLMHVMTIGLIGGIGLLLPACILKWPFVLGFSTSLTLQSGLIAVGLMFIIFRCEIHLHELERGERTDY